MFAQPKVPIGYQIHYAMSILCLPTIWVDFSFNYACELRRLSPVITANWGRDVGYASSTELLKDVG